LKGRAKEWEILKGERRQKERIYLLEWEEGYGIITPLEEREKKLKKNGPETNQRAKEIEGGLLAEWGKSSTMKGGEQLKEVGLQVGEKEKKKIEKEKRVSIKKGLSVLYRELFPAEGKREAGRSRGEKGETGDLKKKG